VTDEFFPPVDALGGELREEVEVTVQQDSGTLNCILLHLEIIRSQGNQTLNVNVEHPSVDQDLVGEVPVLFKLSVVVGPHQVHSFKVIVDNK